MKSRKHQRREADKTRAVIIKAATKLFAERGFSGTPTAMIAAAAKVNEALIFHHFGNKIKLWKKVKEEITEKSQVEPVNQTPSSLLYFIEEAIQQRLELYSNNPLLYRIVQWQRLEAKSKELIADNPLAPNNWIAAIHYLQERNLINKSISVDLIIAWLVSSVNAIIQNDYNIFSDKNSQQEYLKLISVGIEKAIAA